MEINMNLTGLSGMETHELLEPGEYTVRISDCEVRTAKSTGAKYLNLRYDIIDGPKAGRCLFDSLNLWSNNPNAREIAGRKLKSVGLAIHVGNPDFIADTDELLGGEMVVRVAIRRDESGQYPDRNDVKGYKAVAGVPVGKSVPKPAAPNQQTPWG